MCSVFLKVSCQECAFVCSVFLKVSLSVFGNFSQAKLKRYLKQSMEKCLENEAIVRCRSKGAKEVGGYGFVIGLIMTP